jgi:hypothetical protein
VIATTARRRTFGAAAAVLIALVLSACGGATEGAEDTASSDEDAQALAFAQCMRDNGVDMPDPGPGRRGLIEAFRHEDVQGEDQATVEEARAACEDLLPQWDHDPGHQQERDEMMLEIADCLRQRGLDVPDDLEGLQHVDDDELRAAMQECRAEVFGGGHE